MSASPLKIRVADRLKNGEALTAADKVALLEGNTKGSRYVPSKVALATLFGVSRKSIDTWSKSPDAPKPKPNGKHDVGAWAKFIREEGLRGGDFGPVDEFDDDSPEGLEKRKLRLQCEKIEAQIEIMREKWVPEEQLAGSIAELVQVLVKAIEQFPLPNEFASRERACRDGARSAFFDFITRDPTLKNYLAT